MTQIEKLCVTDMRAISEWLLFMRAWALCLGKVAWQGDWGRTMETTSGVLVTRTEDDIGRN